MSEVNSLIATLNSGSNEESIGGLNNFVKKNETAKEFPDIKIDTKTELWTGLTQRIRNPESTPEVIRLCLSVLRILSREKATLDVVVKDEIIDVLLEISKLKESVHFPNCGHEEMLASLKVISNLIFQSQVVQVMFLEHAALEGLMKIIRDFRNDACKYPTDVKYFSMRILFLITALCQHIRPKVRQELKGIIYLSDFLEDQTKLKDPYDDPTVELICESLKALYNIVHDLTPTKSNPDKSEVDEQDFGYLMRMTTIIKLFLVHPTVSMEKQFELQSHSIDLLNAVTIECFEVLVPEGGSPPSQFENKDMSAIDSVVNLLHYRLKQIKELQSTESLLSPVLCVLVRMVRSQRAIRKYLKKKILPPLKKEDITARPEVGDSIRNRLCALLTSPIGRITDMVANFLFVICKENVNRMIKYTGYGNAAGLLANKGLLLGGSAQTEEYSSDSDSDTEDYREVRHLINDVEGYLQEERPPPCEGMSDEQKEYEAMKLVEAIDRLNRQGLIQPCTVSEDGRPIPIEHVLQLQDHSERMRRRRNSDDSDD